MRDRLRRLFLALVIAAALLPSTAAAGQEPATGSSGGSSAGSSAASEPPTRARTYALETLASLTAGGTKLADRFTPEELALLEKLNRRDVEHLARADALVVPAEWLPDELAYSPLPAAVPGLALDPKALVVDLPSQVFGAYELGRLVRWGPISSGRQKVPTPAGLFHLNWRSPARRSTDDPDWFMRWYFNFDNRRGLAFHELELPGRPASHACVRLLPRDAAWLYGWGEGWTLDERRRTVVQPGTPVWIFGRYDFAAPPPWLSLDGLARGVDLPPPLAPP